MSFTVSKIITMKTVNNTSNGPHTHFSTTRPLLNIFLLLVILCRSSQTDALAVDFFRGYRFLPVLHDLQLERVHELGELLSDADIHICSVSLRHAIAMDSAKYLVDYTQQRQGRPPLLVGVSTCVASQQIAAAKTMGAAFVSTVFTTQSLLSVAATHQIPLLAGVTTVEEARLALAGGAAALKFYPASEVSPAQLARITQQLTPRSTTTAATTVSLVAGGVRETDFDRYCAAGASGFAVGVDCRRPRGDIAAQLSRLQSRASTAAATTVASARQSQ